MQGEMNADQIALEQKECRKYFERRSYWCQSLKDEDQNAMECGWFSRSEYQSAQLTTETKRRKATEAYVAALVRWKKGSDRITEAFDAWQATIPAEEKETT